MKNYDESVEINHNLNWPYIPDHPYRILIIGGSGSSKNNVLLNLIKHQQDPFKSKYQLLFSGTEKIGIKKLKNPKAFVDYLQTIDDVYENLEDYNPTKKRSVLIVFDDMIADLESNKKLNPIVTELFLRERKVNISFVFTSQSYLKVPKTMRLNATYYFIMKFPNKRELQQIV